MKTDSLFGGKFKDFINLELKWPQSPGLCGNTEPKAADS